MQLGNKYSHRALEWLHGIKETDRPTWEDLVKQACDRDFVGFMAAAQGELAANSEAVFGKGCTSKMVFDPHPTEKGQPAGPPLNYKWLFDQFIWRYDPALEGGFDPAKPGAERTVQQ